MVGTLNSYLMLTFFFWTFCTLRQQGCQNFGCKPSYSYLIPHNHTLALMHPAGTSKDLDICDFSKVSDIENSMVVNGKMNILKHSSYFSKDSWEIYIEKYNKIWRSNLRWDIYGSNKDDPHIYGFLPIMYIITHMTVHFLSLLSMAQKSINIWIILIGSINVST